MKTVHVVCALAVACAALFAYSEACCHKELVVGLSGLGCLGHLAPSHCGCGCDCDLCLPAHHSGCGCDLCGGYGGYGHGSGCGCSSCGGHGSDCGCGCNGLQVILKKKLKKKKKSIIKEYC